MSLSVTAQNLQARLQRIDITDLVPATRTEKLLYGIVAALPVLWLVGLGEFLWVPIGLVVFYELIRHRSRAFMPRALLLWFGFIALAFISVLDLVLDGQILGVHTHQLTIYLSGALVFVYIYSAAADELADNRVIGAATVLWVLLVVGGFLAIPFHGVEYSTPVTEVLTAADTDERMIYYSEVAFVFDAGIDVRRPRTFFSEANHWGSAYALLLPAVLMILIQLADRTPRRWLVGLLAASFIPLVLSENRWVWAGLIVIGLYALARYWRPRPSHLLWALAAAAAAVIVVAATPVGDVVSDRLSTEGSESDRRRQYEESVEAIERSPLFGFGEAIASDEPELDNRYLGGKSLGWDSQILNTMIFHGIPALLLLVAFIGWLVFATRGTATPIEAVAHLAALTLAFHSVFYIFFPHRFMVLMILGAGALRRQLLDDRYSLGSTIRLWRRRVRES